MHGGLSKEVNVANVGSGRALPIDWGRVNALVSTEARGFLAETVRLRQERKQGRAPFLREYVVGHAPPAQQATYDRAVALIHDRVSQLTYIEQDQLWARYRRYLGLPGGASCAFSQSHPATQASHA